MMIPHDPVKNPAIIIEFKVCSRTNKETLEDAVQSALQQIIEKIMKLNFWHKGFRKKKFAITDLHLKERKC